VWHLSESLKEGARGVGLLGQGDCVPCAALDSRVSSAERRTRSVCRDLLTPAARGKMRFRRLIRFYVKDGRARRLRG